MRIRLFSQYVHLQIAVLALLETTMFFAVLMAAAVVRFGFGVGAFELKEHFIAIGLGVLPAYWYVWKSSDAAAFIRTRNMLTTVLAFVIWWGFLVGHLTNNVRGLGT